MHVVCSIDNSYIPHCAVMLTSLREADPGERIDASILHAGLDASEHHKLASFLNPMLDSVTFTEVDPDILAGFPVYGHLPTATYYRLLIPSVVPPSVEKAVFLDCDLIVVESLSGLWNMRLDGHPLAAVADHHVSENCERLGLSPQAGYFNPGVMLVDVARWRERNLLADGLAFINRARLPLKHCDQDVLNHLFEARWLRLPDRWNACPHIWGLCPLPAAEAAEQEARYADARNCPAVVHFAGSGAAKPWHLRCRHPWKARYLELKQRTPWAGRALESDPPVPPAKSWGLKLRRFLGGAA